MYVYIYIHIYIYIYMPNIARPRLDDEVVAVQVRQAAHADHGDDGLRYIYIYIYIHIYTTITIAIIRCDHKHCYHFRQL